MLIFISMKEAKGAVALNLTEGRNRPTSSPSEEVLFHSYAGLRSGALSIAMT